MAKTNETITFRVEKSHYGRGSSDNDVIVTNFLEEKYNQEWEFIALSKGIVCGMTDDGLKFKFWEKDEDSLALEIELDHDSTVSVEGKKLEVIREK